MIKGTSKVTDFLWVGGTPPTGEIVGRHFDRLILTTAELQLDEGLFPGVQVLHVPLTEKGLPKGEEIKAIQAGRATASWMRRGMNVLVTCALGANRSCLIAAIALMTTGMTADQAIQRVRAARSSIALHSPHYVHLLHRLENIHQYRLAVGI